MSEHRIIFGDAKEVLRTLPEESVDCVFTSPPYWSLRDYGVAGQIGLEATVEEYVARLVEVFAGVRRVLADHGTLALNLGDSYARAGGWSDNSGLDGLRRGESGRAMSNIPINGSKSQVLVPGLKPKDLIGIPWRVAFALQADGWWLRNDVIWVKPNAMPESVTDRFAATHEHVFLLSRSARYWFDLNAVRVQHRSDHAPGNQSRLYVQRSRIPERLRPDQAHSFHPLGKNPGDVVTLATQPTPYAHFATFPLDLVLRFLPALCPPRVCAACGEPWEHRVEKTGNPAGICGGEHREPERAGGLANGRPRDYEAEKRIGKVRDLGYFPACDCGTEAWMPGTVLDPFLGSGTTTQAARKLGRRSIGIELNRAYEQVMRQRLGCPKGALISDVEFESGEATT